MNKIIIGLALSLLVSCTSVRRADEGSLVYISDDAALSLCRPTALDKPVSLIQYINGKYGDSEYTMQVILEMDESHLSVTAFSVLGSTVYDLVYDGKEIRMKSLPGMQGLDPAYMVADIQFCYYPEEALKGMLKGSGLRLEVESNAESLDSQAERENWTRRILDGEETLIEIRRRGAVLEFRNILRNYSYRIEESYS